MSTPAMAPRLQAPPGACDTHMHVYESRLPLAPTSPFVPPDAPAAAYREVMRRLGLARCVIVQPSPYGFDNSAFRAAPGTHPERTYRLAATKRRGAGCRTRNAASASRTTSARDRRSANAMARSASCCSASMAAKSVTGAASSLSPAPRLNPLHALSPHHHGPPSRSRSGA